MSQSAASAAAQPLNTRQRRFAEELAICSNAVEAQEKAGFKPHRGNAARLAADPRVQAVVEQIQMDAAKLAGVHLGRVLMEQARIAYFNIGDVLFRDERGQIVLDRSGMPIIDYSLMTHDHFAAVSKIDFEKGKIEFHDKVGVLRDLVKYLAPEKAGGDKPPGEGGSTFIVNNNLLQLINKFEGMSDLDIARRIAFSLELGKRNLAAPPAAQTHAESGHGR